MIAPSLPTPAASPGTTIVSYEPAAARLKTWVRYAAEIQSPRLQAGDLNAALTEACNEATEPNWDGFGALPVQGDACQAARLLVEQLPSWADSPSVGVDPDGEVSFEWINGPRRRFSISLNDRGRLAYAGMYGPRRTRGIDYFFDQVPSVVFENLRRLYSGGRA